MSMQLWIDQRSVKLLQDINAVPFTDDHDMKKLILIKKAIREASAEVVRRAVERSVAEIISDDAMSIPGRK